ncbi:MAG: hypothetical protein RJA81_636, partial [Planctomycetota bacterium]
LMVFASHSGICFGDSFFDFGLQWTQWIPSRGEVQTFEGESTAAILSVPMPKQAWRTMRAAESEANKAPGNMLPVNSNVTSTLEFSRPKVESIVDSNQDSIKNTASNTAPVISFSQPHNEYQPVSNVETHSYSPLAFTPPQPTAATTVPVSNFVPPVAPTPNPDFQAPAPGQRYDALIRMDGGPFPSADSLVTGQTRAWYQSPVVQSLFGGIPSVDQQKSFEQDVLQKVMATYQQSGVNVNLTLDPSSSAARTISVVSGASYGPMAEAAGITAMSGDGFSFIDKLGSAQSIKDLEWALAHNVAHELLHAFDVPHHDTTGSYLDAAVANWNMMIDPNTKFSAAAVADLQNKLSGKTGGSYDLSPNAYGLFGQQLSSATNLAQIIDVQPVPEPSTIMGWLVGMGVALVVRKQRNRSNQVN